MTEWYILPGMGASSNMYNSLEYELSFDAHFLNWPTYKNEVSFMEIAERIIEENRISEDDIVGGSSLGGMVALEVAMILNIKAVVLIGSAMSGNEVNKLLSKFSPLVSVAPISFMQALFKRNEHIASQMFAASDPEFMRAMCEYMPSWPGYHGDIEKIYRVHGKKDHIISCPESGCEVIKNAGHLLAITHSRECATFLEKTKSHLTSAFTATAKSRRP